MSIKVNVGNVAKEMDKGWVNINRVAHEIDKMYVNVGGLAKEGYASGLVLYNYIEDIHGMVLGYTYIEARKFGGNYEFIQNVGQPLKIIAHGGRYDKDDNRTYYYNTEVATISSLIDFTNYNTITIEFDAVGYSSGATSSSVALYIHSIHDCDPWDSKIYVQSLGNNYYNISRKNIQIDVSTISGFNYISLTATGDGTSAKLTVYKLWLE